MLEALGVAVVGFVVVVLGVVLNDWAIHGQIYRRFRNRSARARGESEPYPNGRLRPEARKLALERLRARRPLVIVVAIGLLVVGVVNELAHANGAMRIRGVGEIAIGLAALYVVSFRASASRPT